MLEQLRLSQRRNLSTSIKLASAAPNFQKRSQHSRNTASWVDQVAPALATTAQYQGRTPKAATGPSFDGLRSLGIPNSQNVAPLDVVLSRGELTRGVIAQVGCANLPEVGWVSPSAPTGLKLVGRPLNDAPCREGVGLVG